MQANLVGEFSQETSNIMRKSIIALCLLLAPLTLDAKTTDAKTLDAKSLPLNKLNLPDGSILISDDHADVIYRVTCDKQTTRSENAKAGSSSDG